MAYLYFLQFTFASHQRNLRFKYTLSEYIFRLELLLLKYFPCKECWKRSKLTNITRTSNFFILYIVINWDHMTVKIYVRTPANFILRCNIPANIYLFKINNRNTRKSYEICSKVTKKTPERRLKSLWCLYWWLWTNLILFSVFFVVVVNLNRLVFVKIFQQF